MIKYGVLHCHTEHSLNDSAMSCEELVKKAKELGAPAVALTDHGDLFGIETFRKVCKENDIKPILGVEAYYKGDYKKSHLILMAKNYKGFQAIMKAISKANHNIDSQKAPIITKEDLIHYFGKGSIGYGNVVATSACAGGVLANVLLQNKEIEKKINKINNFLSKLPSPVDKKYTSVCNELDDIRKQLAETKEEVSRLDALSKKKYLMRENRLKKLTGEEYDKEKSAIEAEKSESDFAAKKVVEIRKQRTELSKKETLLKKEIKSFEDKFARRNEFENELVVLESGKKNKQNLLKEAKAELSFFKDVFVDFFVELQYHKIPEEKFVYPLLAQMARETNTPIVVANDVHIPDNSKESLRARQIMCSLRFNEYQELNVGDEELYVKTDEELTEILSQILPSDVIEEGFKNIGKIVDMCNVVYPKEDNYPQFECPDGKSSKQYLRELAEQGISWRYSDNEWTKVHQDRLDYELGVIDKLGFNDYHLVVRDFLQYGRLLGQLDELPDFVPTMEELEAMPKAFPTGVGVGPGRGSAVGSLTCYLLGITALDPLKYNLIFERFLNEERVTMPDIDSDFRSDIREIVVKYCENKYGKNAVCGIIALSTQQEKDSVRNCARIYSSQKYGNGETLYSLGDTIAKSFNPKEESFDTMRQKFAGNEEALQILNDAELVCGTVTNVSKHAAGVVISGSPSVTDYLPVAFVKGTQSYCAQFDKKQVEKLRCLKMDFLGLKNLGIINDALRLIYKHYNTTFDVEKLPMEDKVFKDIFQSGITNNVFQLESPGMKKMLIDFKPSTFEDIILLVAAYRPGPMQYLPEVLAVKKGEKSPSYIIPELAEILDTTYGKPIYQEQVMQIFNKCAGFSLGESDIIRRLMSSKDVEGFSQYKPKFIDGLTKKGASKSDAETFWSELEKFSQYAFNKSHATAYAQVAYITAYLKCYYPREFFCATANYLELAKINTIATDCDTFNIKFRVPDINESQDRFTLVNGALLFGLSKVKEIGKDGAVLVSHRNKKGVFTSFADFMIKTHCSKSTAKYLIMAGAFDKFAPNRSELIRVLPEYLEFSDKIKDKEAKIAKIQIDLADETLTTSKKEKLEKTLASHKDGLSSLISAIHGLVYDKSEEDLISKLNDEKDALGATISASFLDGYSIPEENGCTPLSQIGKGNYSVMGYISNIRIAKKKSNNKDMAFFELEDQTGIVKVSMFDIAYSKFGHLISENAVIKFTGYTKIEEYNEEEQVKFIVDEAEILQPNKKAVTIFVKDEIDWVENILPIIPLYRKKDGHKVKLHTEYNNMYRTVLYAVNDEEKELFGNEELAVGLDILEDPRISTFY